jgi:prepilin-type processing-associated H-X9-DG protein
MLPKLVLPSGVGNTPKIAILRMCYGEKGTVKFLETLADNVFRHLFNDANYEIFTYMNILFGDNHVQHS